MTRSYSKKAYPWDNACIESFHAIIKRECLNEYNISSYNKARRLVFSYIDGFYNTVRIHSHCGYISPLEFEQTYFDKVQKVNKAA
nr:integrase core domain-containing protein [Ligilactobacillus salivarius]